MNPMKLNEAEANQKQITFVAQSFVGFFVPYTYMVDMAISYGISADEAAFLLSIIGIANTVSRVACGWIADRPWGNSLIVNNCALIVGGVATLFCPWMKSYELLGPYSFVFGVSVGRYIHNLNCYTIFVFD